MRTFQKLIIWIREIGLSKSDHDGYFDPARDRIGRGSGKRSPSSYDDCRATVTLEDSHEVAQLSVGLGAD
jgi:hypothetical protein